MSIVYKVMDSGLCSSKHDTEAKANAELKRLRADFQDAVNIAEQDLEDFNENFYIEEIDDEVI